MLDVCDAMCDEGDCGSGAQVRRLRVVTLAPGEARSGGETLSGDPSGVFKSCEGGGGDGERA